MKRFGLSGLSEPKRSPLRRQWPVNNARAGCRSAKPKRFPVFQLSQNEALPYCRPSSLKRFAGKRPGGRKRFLLLLPVFNTGDKSRQNKALPAGDSERSASLGKGLGEESASPLSNRCYLSTGPKRFGLKASSGEALPSQKPEQTEALQRGSWRVSSGAVLAGSASPFSCFSRTKRSPPLA